MSTNIKPEGPSEGQPDADGGRSRVRLDISRSADLMGVLNSPEVYSGPRIVQIDLTNNCNTDCIACWTHSPLLGEERFVHPVKGYTLPSSAVRSLIEDLALLGTEEIILAGAGEPFLHPDIMGILELIGRKGLKCNVITNGTFLEEDVARRLIEWGISMLTVSVWAGDGQTYARNHPSKTSRVYDKIVEDLERLAALKAARSSSRPKVKLTHVISSYNSHNIREILAMGLKVAAEQLELTTVDIVEGKTDVLALSEGDAEAILKALDDARGWGEYTEAFTEGNGSSYGWFLPAPDGMTVDGRKLTLTCQAGIEVPAASMSDGEGRVLFAFPQEECCRCSVEACPVDRSNPLWSLKAMENFNVDNFVRRVKTIAGLEAESGRYDLHYIDTVPCTVGWIYARVMVDGSVIPCCRGSKKPLGNLEEESFSAIWKSSRYKEFRHKALTFEKSDPYFAPIGCYKMCDNLAMIEEVASRLERLSEEERSRLESEAARSFPL